MNEQPNPAEFSANEKPREYEVTFRVSGTISMTIEADSKEEAQRKAEAMIDDEKNEWIDIENADEISIQYVRKSPTMYRITRDGKDMQTSRLMPGDLPRQPDKRGF